MRKLLSIVLCLVMVFCFTVPAMAVTETDDAQENVIGDVAELQGETLENVVTVVVEEPATVYKVTVTWEDDLVFKYKYGAWNSNESVLNYSSESKWLDDTKAITVKSCSNAPVDVVAAMAATPLNNVNVSLDGPTTLDLASAEGENGANGSVQSGTFNVKVTGTPTNSTVGEFPVGTVTISLTPGV